MTAISGYTRCDCDWFVPATGDACGECGHDRDQHNIGYGDECLAQEGDAPGAGLPEGVLTGAEQDQVDGSGQIDWEPVSEERYCVDSGRPVQLISGDRCLSHGARGVMCTTAVRDPRCEHPRLSKNHPYPKCEECGRSGQLAGAAAPPPSVVDHG